ncbi:Mitochondrial import receptor subunit TOM40-1 [Dichanthelium oligosanthes]|uniref:Mitochondrial import receptor subunit TOM40-1 n=1 Tax=Dichanthelium oligosanthes TaxID=888268 RepID=A0A1E5UKS0_9POAL|nr:Mitochondrial import receptor subunit TOM40-1 [Dichanthelium oligosanthes]
MGSSVSQAAAPPPPPPPPAYGAPPPFAAAEAPPPKPHEEEAAEQKVDYLNLPCPVPYEEIQREAFLALKPELFEGMRFDFTKMVSQVFALSHSVSMGSMEVPAQGSDVIKIPTSNYEFGANFINHKMMLMGRISHEGREIIRVKYDLTENLSVKINAQLTSEPHYSQGMFNFDYKLACLLYHFINNKTLKDIESLYIFYAFQSVTKNLSLGTEAFWLGQQRKSGVGVVARYDTKKWVATGQIATTGMVALSYVQRVSEKVSLASDFMYNQMTKDVTASFGYDYVLRQIDHWKKDYKFGFGMAVGE